MKNKEINIGWVSPENPIAITEFSMEYTQEGDSNSSDYFQSLELQITDAGDGSYFVLKTERWAFDSVEELIEVLEDFKRRSIGTETKKIK